MFACLEKHTPEAAPSGWPYITHHQNVDEDFTASDSHMVAALCAQGRQCEVYEIGNRKGQPNLWAQWSLRVCILLMV